jgi:glycosyltransferase involved in cell wall biosynthesis
MTIGNPEVSILLYNYSAEKLEACLKRIFSQTDLIDFEVVISDDASNTSSWEVASHYALANNGRITISSNRQSIGSTRNKEKGLCLCKGNYGIFLTEAMEFEPAYVAAVLLKLETDPFMEHVYISRLKQTSVMIPPYSPINNTHANEYTAEPLVSICIYNFNYGRYLRQCLDSVFTQTYVNFEICFSDNASTDDSWEIALEYKKKYPNRISLTRNRMNFGPNTNLFNCLLNVSGKYMLKLCSDDAIRADFLERCVTAMKQHPAAAFAVTHRDIMDVRGNCTPEQPFYDQSCLIPGTEQAAVYMMTSFNPSISQVLYDIRKMEGKRMAGNLNDRWFGDRIMDFHLACNSPIIYINEPLLLNRVHDASDGAHMSGNLLQVLSEYVLLHQLSDIAASYGNTEKAVDRLQPGLKKLGELCLRYCARHLAMTDETTARRYLRLAEAISPEIEKNTIHQELSKYWESDDGERKAIRQRLQNDTTGLITRTVSYPPPPGYIAL